MTACHSKPALTTLKKKKKKTHRDSRNIRRSWPLDQVSQLAEAQPQWACEAAVTGKVHSGHVWYVQPRRAEQFACFIAFFWCCFFITQFKLSDIFFHLFDFFNNTDLTCYSLWFQYRVSDLYARLPHHHNSVYFMTGLRAKDMNSAQKYKWPPNSMLCACGVFIEVNCKCTSR